jgi:hypothetical protein
MQVELFGTPDTSGKFPPEDGFGRLAEVTFYLTPAEMKTVAAFIAKCADEAGALELWDHEHFIDNVNDPDYSGPDIIIVQQDRLDGR